MEKADAEQHTHEHEPTRDSASMAPLPVGSGRPAGEIVGQRLRRRRKLLRGDLSVLARLAGEFHGNDKRAARTRPKCLQPIDHLQRHRLTIDKLRRGINGLQGLAVALGLEDL